MSKSVLVIGLTPELVDYSAFPGLSAEKVRAGIASQIAKLNESGYAAVACYVDLGETAEATVVEQLSKEQYACVVIGAGIRVAPPHFLLFEKLINVVHAHAPRSKIAFNTNPTDTANAVARSERDR